MGQILIRENAEKNFLQAAEDEVNIVVIFDGDVRSVYTAEGADDEILEALYSDIAAENPGGGTDMYAAAAMGIEEAVRNYDIDNYCPAVIIMSDGASETSTREDFISEYNACGYPTALRG